MYPNPAANPPPAPYSPRRPVWPLVVGGVVVVGAVAGGMWYATRALRVPPTPPSNGPPPQALTGNAGSVMIGQQDASWNITSAVPPEAREGLPQLAPRYSWNVYAMPAGTFLDSSPTDFASADETRVHLLAYGQSQGWSFA